MSIIDIVLCKVMEKGSLIKEVRILGAYLRKDPNQINPEAEAVYENAECLDLNFGRVEFELIKCPLDTLIVDHVSGPEDTDSAIESMVRAGYLEPLLGEDGKFYYRPKENKNVSNSNSE